MAIGWMAVLQLVPWSDVISNAPKIAEGAKKLWSTVGKKPPLEDVAPLAVDDRPSGMAALEQRLQAMETAASELHEQMLASADLIRTLAEQNTQLVKRIEVNRARLVMLAAATVVVAVIAIASLTLLLMR
ncbi:MAG: hypothetical protein HYX42_05235 [Polaromonas sp.]|uniref:hypothetical protein n=1 Tax=Polaromonas sp. TaxID=1869339 RepID=UPI0025F37B86|nr:hypothetical protein [Polaromonas sp.]MBI2725636.1 hypothetical protein [Polaromonas sp.]